MIERKGVTATIHLRGVEEPEQAEDAVYQDVADGQPRWAACDTRQMVVELRPPLEMDKGVAIEGFIRKRGDCVAHSTWATTRPISTPSEHCGGSLAEGVCQGIAVAVRHSEAPTRLATEADMTLPSAEATPSFLRWLLANTPT